MSPSSSCSRWSPSPQQVMILEELYRRGVRTPNAFQRQIITAHLSFYAHIHPKNVFYWFQNHKARYRLKLMSKKHPNHRKTILDFQSNTTYGTQGNGGGDEEMRRAEMIKEEQNWKVHDLMMMLETCPCCKNRPLVTLQLFPLTSSK